MEEIDILNKQLAIHFKDKFVIQPVLTRSLVSFQANKTRAVYRWYKFKEGFSASLIEYLLQQYKIKGKILDPFAGSGTALFAASSLGMEADGIELLPVGHQIIEARKYLENEITPEDIARLKHWAKTCVWKQSADYCSLTTLRITKGAYPEQTLKAIEQYLGALQKENNQVRTVLQFALLCVLESVSYTRKDGQYLRWDYRSERQEGKIPFNKGSVLDLEQAVSAKIAEILWDLESDCRELFPTNHVRHGTIRLYKGSCLEIMPTLPGNIYDSIITSPPYCNRYDYTRTYALELALLGTDEKEIIRLRQQMLSCTVENRPKNLLAINRCWEKALAVTEKQELLQAILQYLENQKLQKILNNNGIPRMVRGYFCEMACVIAESARLMKSGALLFMVNDNVRYAGASISTDMILSNIAENLGFHVENILVLPNGKGNSSQQMGEHGRVSLRKCVYVWRKIWNQLKEGKLDNAANLTDSKQIVSLSRWLCNL